MPSITRRTVEENEVICYNLNDLSSIVRLLEDLPDNAEFELCVELELPGIGKKILRLLDDVVVKVKWKVVKLIED